MRCTTVFKLFLGKIKINPALHLKFNYPNEEVNHIILHRKKYLGFKVTETEQERTILHIAYGCGLRANKEVSQLNKEDFTINGKPCCCSERQEQQKKISS